MFLKSLVLYCDVRYRKRGDTLGSYVYKQFSNITKTHSNNYFSEFFSLRILRLHSSSNRINLRGVHARACMCVCVCVCVCMHAHVRDSMWVCKHKYLLQIRVLTRVLGWCMHIAPCSAVCHKQQAWY
jgi:hypothetical protein